MLSREESLSALVRELKRDSSKEMKTKSPHLRTFYWQSGYGAFAVSPSHVEALKRYIANQEEHHRRKTFAEEYEEFVRIYGLQWRDDDAPDGNR